MLRIPHCLDNRLIDGGKVVSPTHQRALLPRNNIFFNVSGTHFCYRLSNPQGLVRPEELDKFTILLQQVCLIILHVNDLIVDYRLFVT
jgi:hypothetical protein